jgi:hypothetical protein
MRYSEPADLYAFVQGAAKVLVIADY